MKQGILAADKSMKALNKIRVEGGLPKCKNIVCPHCKLMSTSLEDTIGANCPHCNKGINILELSK